MEIDARDSLVSQICSVGFYAVKRDWSLGRTIICSRKVDKDCDGLSVMIDVVTLVPVEGGEWKLQFSGFSSDLTISNSDVLPYLSAMYANDGLKFQDEVKAIMRRISAAKRKG